MNGSIGDEKHSFRLPQKKLLHLAELVLFHFDCFWIKIMESIKIRREHLSNAICLKSE